MDVFVGTSGWYYDWNKKKNFDWFIKNSSLNSVELNASFYRFPFPRQIEVWSTKGTGLRWSIKVHRSITHWRQHQQRNESRKTSVDKQCFRQDASFRA